MISDQKLLINEIIKRDKNSFRFIFFEKPDVKTFKKVCNIINQFKDSNEMDSLGKELEMKINYLFFFNFYQFFLKTKAPH